MIVEVAVDVLVCSPMLQAEVAEDIASYGTSRSPAPAPAQVLTTTAGMTPCHRYYIFLHALCVRRTYKSCTETSQTSTTFNILRLATIESDAKPHKVTVAFVSLDAKFKYSAVPKVRMTFPSISDGFSLDCVNLLVFCFLISLIGTSSSIRTRTCRRALRTRANSHSSRGP